MEIKKDTYTFYPDLSEINSIDKNMAYLPHFVFWVVGPYFTTYRGGKV